MNRMQVYNFSDLYKISSGISTKPNQANHGSPFLSFKTVFNNYYILEDLGDLMNVSEEELKAYSIKKGDIFLTRTSETLDELGMSCVALRDYEKATFSGFLKRLRPVQDNVTYDKYMAFYLRSNFFRKIMTANSIMTLRASFNEQIFSYLKLFLPSYAEQKRIGDLLFSLSDRIELNNKMNAELEKMAKTLYDYWFVQFDFPDENGKPYQSSGGSMVYNAELKRMIPEGWEVKSLDVAAEIIGGSTPSKEIDDFFSTDIGTSWITPKDLSINTTNKFIDRGEFNVTGFGIKNANLKLMPKGTVIMSSRAPIGYLAIASNTVTTNQGCKSFVPKSNFSSQFIYYLVQNLLPVFINNASGSTFKEVSSTTLKSIQIPIPKENIITKYSQKAKSIFEQQQNLIKQNQTLASLRDWLLPMLMNGQITVGNAYAIRDEAVSKVAEP